MPSEDEKVGVAKTYIWAVSSSKYSQVFSALPQSVRVKSAGYPK